MEQLDERVDNKRRQATVSYFNGAKLAKQIAGCRKYLECSALNRDGLNGVFKEVVKQVNRRPSSSGTFKSGILPAAVTTFYKGSPPSQPVSELLDEAQNDVSKARNVIKKIEDMCKHNKSTNFSEITVRLFLKDAFTQ